MTCCSACSKSDLIRHLCQEHDEFLVAVDRMVASGDPREVLAMALALSERARHHNETEEARLMLPPGLHRWLEREHVKLRSAELDVIGLAREASGDRSLVPAMHAAAARLATVLRAHIAHETSVVFPAAVTSV